MKKKIKWCFKWLVWKPIAWLVSNVFFGIFCALIGMYIMYNSMIDELNYAVQNKKCTNPNHFYSPPSESIGLKQSFKGEKRQMLLNDLVFRIFNLTYYRYYGITKICNNISSWSDVTDEHYHFTCPRCETNYITRYRHKSSNNSGRLTLDPPDVVCEGCGLHLIIKDGEAEIVYD